MLIFPEILTKEEVEDLNQMADDVERFFKEKGWFYFSVIILEHNCRLLTYIYAFAAYAALEALCFCLFHCGFHPVFCLSCGPMPSIFLLLCKFCIP